MSFIIGTHESIALYSTTIVAHADLSVRLVAVVEVHHAEPLSRKQVGRTDGVAVNRELVEAGTGEIAPQ